MEELNKKEINKIEMRAKPDNLIADRISVPKKVDKGIQDIEVDTLLNPDSQVSFLKDKAPELFEQITNLKLELAIIQKDIKNTRELIINGPEEDIDKNVNLLKMLENNEIKKINEIKALGEKQREKNDITIVSN